MMALMRSALLLLAVASCAVALDSPASSSTEGLTQHLRLGRRVLAATVVKAGKKAKVSPSPPAPPSPPSPPSPSPPPSPPSPPPSPPSPPAPPPSPPSPPVPPSPPPVPPSPPTPPPTPPAPPSPPASPEAPPPSPEVEDWGFIVSVVLVGKYGQGQAGKLQKALDRLGYSAYPSKLGFSGNQSMMGLRSLVTLTIMVRAPSQVAALADLELHVTPASLVGACPGGGLNIASVLFAAL